MRATFLLLLLLALVNPSMQYYFGNWQPISNATVSTDPQIRSLANATINWHNKQRNAHIVLLNVTGGLTQVIGNMGVVLEVHYVLFVDVLQPKPNNRIAMKHYQCFVFDHPPKDNALSFMYFGKRTWPRN
ncbi:hypothetical protein FCM35_KLT20497 [Carex littledalei]|uniref:Cystatin domain-containing protein n=1 Tax=Carex littledalei TaxID=544730 RepID=A0A833QVP9_9POAL|nr:hypothetical protein FCM35_KLT20497 [Carex littledalei]